MNDAEAAAWFVLARAPGLHADHLKPLPEAAHPADLLRLGAKPLVAAGWPPAAVRWVDAPDWRAVEADRRWAERAGVRLVPCRATGYPQQLRDIPTAPVVLWIRGETGALREPQLAIVGSRRATPAGRRVAAALAGDGVRAGLVITSGLAEGIDAAAHRGALDAGGRSVAVCGTGLDTCYPPRHEALAERIAASGAVVSEFPPGTEPRPHHFPRRNRIISGLALGVLVVEAARDSGSLITARLALEQHRHLLAVPGPIASPLSRGCHELIRAGAALVESSEDVLRELQWQPDCVLQNQLFTSGAIEGPPGRQLDMAQEMLLDALGFEPASIDELIVRTGQQAQDIAVSLSLLELEGLVEALPGGRYGRNSHPPTDK